jgi:DNA-binding winged helix-turn-helix (wHTH) protein
MTGAAKEIALGPFKLNLTDTRLLRDGVILELRPQVFRVFKVLIQNYGQLVEYEQLIREAWDVHVSRHTVATTVNELKNLLEEHGDWIVCRPRLGYFLKIPESEDMIRRGRHFWNLHTRTGYENALKYFQQAAENDADDFRAFAAISSTYLMLASFLMRAPGEIHGAFLEAHNRAVRLCGMTPELRLDHAFGLYIFEHKLAEAEAELLAVRRELPDSANLNIRLALIYLASGRLAAARAAMFEAQAADAHLFAPRHVPVSAPRPEHEEVRAAHSRLSRNQPRTPFPDRAIGRE